MKESISYIDPQNVVERAFSAIGLANIKDTQPEIMRNLFKEMHLENLNTSYLPLKNLLETATHDPINLTEFLGQVKHGLVNNPIVIDFLDESVNLNLLAPDKNFIKALNFAYILEQLTQAQANSITASKEIQQFFYDERKKNGVDTMHPLSAAINVAKLSKSPFKTAKMMSVTPFMKKFLLERENGGPFTLSQVEDLRKSQKISSLEKILIKPHDLPKEMNHAAIQLNILEAGTEEYLTGFKNNAFVAYALKKGCELKEKIDYKKGIVRPVSFNIKGSEISLSTKESASSENIHPEYAFSKDWVNLYESWNMSFVVGDLDDLHLILPKLFIPSQIDSKPEDYLFNRLLSLDGVINFCLFRVFDDVTNEPQPKNHKEIAQLWGAINKQHAFRYIHKELGMNPKDLEKESEMHYKNGASKFVSMAKDYITK